MKAGTLLVMAGLAATLAPVAASGQASGTVRLATVERTASSPRAVLLDDGELDARLASADRALKRGSEARARSIYEAIASELRAEDRLPTAAVWRLAAMEYSAGFPLKAAAMLDALSVEAETKKDLTVQIMSLFEAAHVYALEGMSAESAERLDRGVRLLGVSDLPMETRVALMKKVRV
jgi:hypothetical protein